MVNFLLKFGMMLMSVAIFFIFIGFFILGLFAVVMILPGLVVYNAGLKLAIKNIYAQQTANGEVYDENGMKVINGTVEGQESNPGNGNQTVNKAKLMLKSTGRRIRDFLNKYVD